MSPARRAVALAAGALVLVAAVGGVVALVLLGGGGGGSGTTARTGTGTVVRVVDGDTLVVDLGGGDESVRLIGIDTPETVAPNRPVECFGAEASHHLAALLPPGSGVRLERDVEPRDRYDRLLAYVYRADDGLFVNGEQVGGGFAVAKDFPPNSARRAELERAERVARTARAGLWAACGGPDVAVGPPPSATGGGGR